jgi:ABC-2 type transport system ATP-binding protein
LSASTTTLPRIALDGVSRSYGNREVLAPLTLDLPAGQTLGLLGPNGAGKSTLMSIMACVLSPTHGQVRLDGATVATQADARRARASIGYLQQKPSWVPAFTALETVEYAAWLKKVSARERAQQAMWALRQVGLGDVVGRRMRELSGGMVQRVCLAAELVAHPRLLILDEPTVGLDPEQRLEFRALVSGLADVTVVLSTHLVEDIAVMADRLIVLDRGSVAFEGRPTDLGAAASVDAPGATVMEQGYMTVLRSSERGDDE